RVVARVEAALDAHLSDRIGLVPGRDFQDAFSDACGRQAQRRAEPGEPALGGARVERNLAAEQRRRDAAENEMGVGRRPLITAAAIAHGTRVGARALGPDAETAVAADARDAAAPAADCDDV